MRKGFGRGCLHAKGQGLFLLHAVLNVMTMFMQGFFEGNSLQYEQADINFWESLKQSLISQSVFIIVALFVMRPSVVKRIVAARHATTGCPKASANWW